jgi:hypothetical protein
MAGPAGSGQELILPQILACFTYWLITMELIEDMEKSLLMLRI